MTLHAASGGLLLRSWAESNGQYADTTVAYFEDAKHGTAALEGSGTHVELRLAIERLNAARSRAFEEADKAS